MTTIRKVGFNIELFFLWGFSDRNVELSDKSKGLLELEQKTNMGI